VSISLFFRRNRPATPTELLAAQERASAIGLPITRLAQVVYVDAEERLQARRLLDSITAKILLIGDKPEDKSDQLDWTTLETSLNNLVSTSAFSLDSGVIGQAPLIGQASRLAKITLAEAERRMTSDDLAGSVALFTSFRKFAEHSAFQQTLVSLLAGVTNWRRLADSLGRLTASQIEILPEFVLRRPTSPALRQVLIYEFIFQWNQLASGEEITPCDAELLLDDERSRRFAFLENWALLYSELKDCKAIVEVDPKYQSARERMTPYKRSLFSGPIYPIDSLDWRRMASIESELSDVFKKLRSD